MTWEEWEKEYVRIVNIPPKVIYATENSCSAASHVKDSIEISDQHGGMEIVRCQDLYYVTNREE